MRLYDIHTDSFLTDRNAIVDQLVIRAACLLTYANRGDRDDMYILPPCAGSLLQEATDGITHAWPLKYAVTTMWRADVAT